MMAARDSKKARKGKIHDGGSHGVYMLGRVARMPDGSRWELSKFAVDLVELARVCWSWHTIAE